MAKGKHNPLFETGTRAVKEVIKDEIDIFTKEDLMIAVPARVIGIQDYTSLQCVDVQPVINPSWIDGRTVAAPAIRKVFVKLPSGGAFNITYPIAAGDLVTLHYSHKDLSAWLDSGGEGNITQNVDRLPEERDCWVTHGFGTRSNNSRPNKDNIEITSVKGSNFTILVLNPDGEISISSSTSINVNSPDVTVTASSGATIKANTTIEGNLNVTGDIGATNVDATVEVTAAVGTVSLSTHTHGGGTASGGNTLAPNPVAPP